MIIVIAALLVAGGIGAVLDDKKGAHDVRPEERYRNAYEDWWMR